MKELEQIKNYLNDVNFKFSIDKKSKYENLIVSGDDSGLLKFPISIMKIPEEDSDNDITYIQFYFESHIHDKYNKNDLAQKLLKWNKNLPYGSLNFFNDRVYFRTVMICNNKNVDKEILFDIMTTVLFALDMAIY